MLTRRQERSYEDLADVYEPLDITKKTGSSRMADRSFSATPIATGVPCLLLSRPESATGGAPIGRTDVDNLFTLDVFRFAADAKRDDGTALLINDNYAIKLKTVGHPDYDGWFIAAGGSKIRINRSRRKSNTQSVNVKRTLKPPGVT